MSKIFIYIFIIFAITTSSIIFFIPNDKKEETDLIKDKNIKNVIKKKIHTSENDLLVKQKIKEEKQKILTKKNKDIKTKIKEIDKLILETDALIKSNKLTVSNNTNKTEDNKKIDKIDKLNQKYKNIKSDLEKLK